MVNATDQVKYHKLLIFTEIHSHWDTIIAIWPGFC